MRWGEIKEQQLHAHVMEKTIIKKIKSVMKDQIFRGTLFLILGPLVNLPSLILSRALGSRTNMRGFKLIFGHNNSDLNSVASLWSAQQAIHYNSVLLRYVRGFTHSSLSCSVQWFTSGRLHLITSKTFFSSPHCVHHSWRFRLMHQLSEWLSPWRVRRLWCSTGRSLHPAAATVHLSEHQYIFAWI